MVGNTDIQPYNGPIYKKMYSGYMCIAGFLFIAETSEI